MNGIDITYTHLYPEYSASMNGVDIKHIYSIYAHFRPMYFGYEEDPKVYPALYSQGHNVSDN